jgi:glycosyltransferase involved in cell wall biosynthesis
MPQPPDLIVAGDGAELEALQALVRSLGLTENVHLVGRADRPTAVSLFKGCVVFVLPSRQEPQGIVIAEAMACRKPVIASNVGGVPEVVVDGVTGILFPKADIGALATALESALANPERAANMGAAGRARVEARFTWEHIADEYCRIYRQVSRKTVEARLACET